MKEAFFGNYKSFNTWKIRHKIPTAMISRQNCDFLSIFSNGYGFFRNDVSLTNCTKCLEFYTNEAHDRNF